MLKNSFSSNNNVIEDIGNKEQLLGNKLKSKIPTLASTVVLSSNCNNQFKNVFYLIIIFKLIKLIKVFISKQLAEAQNEINVRNDLVN